MKEHPSQIDHTPIIEAYNGVSFKPFENANPRVGTPQSGGSLYDVIVAYEGREFSVKLKYVDPLMLNWESGAALLPRGISTPRGDASVQYKIQNGQLVPVLLPVEPYFELDGYIANSPAGDEWIAGHEVKWILPGGQELQAIFDDASIPETVDPNQPNAFVILPGDDLDINEYQLVITKKTDV